jgi:hypothetical protein
MAKKLITIAFAVLLTAAAFAADSTQVKKFTRWYAGVSITPGVSYRWLKENKGVNPVYGTFRQEDVDTRNHNESPQFGGSAGFKFGFKPVRFLAIESGLEYAYLSYYDNKQSFRQYQGTGLGGDTVSYLYKSKHRYQFHYINIPLGLNLTVGKKKVQLIVSAGVVLNLSREIVIESSEYVNSQPPFKYTNKMSIIYREINLSPYAGIGLDFRPSPAFTLRVMPTFQIQARKNTVNTEPIAERLYSAGLNISFLFNVPKKK